MKDSLIKILNAFPVWGKTLKDHWFDQAIERLADHLLANCVIVLPCKVGDTVYYLTTEDTEKELNVTDIFCGTVKGLGFDGTNIWISAKYTNGLFYYHKSTDFGKTVFLTKEEAEKALAEREAQNER